MSCSSQNLSYLASLLPITASTETGDIVLLALGVGDDKIAWSFTRDLIFWVMQKEDRNSYCFYALLQILSCNVKTVTSFFLVARNFSFATFQNQQYCGINICWWPCASLSGVDWNIFTFTTCSVLETLAGWHVSPWFLSLITNLVILRKHAEWLQSYVLHRSHNIITALQNYMERLSLCTSSTVECNLIFFQHVITYFVRICQVRKNTNHPSRNCLTIFCSYCPISMDRLQDEIPVVT
jgi:hypothetical protein